MTNKLSYYPDTVTNLSLKDYFSLLLKNTGENGMLYIPDEESACDLIESDDVFRLEMGWNEGSVKELLAEAENFKTSFAEIANVTKEIENNEETAKKLLSSDAFNIWNTYVKFFDLSAFDTEELGTIHEKNFNEEKLTKEEQETFEQYKTSIHAEAADRLGGGLNTYETVLHAMRYVKLLEINVAPEIVLDHEFRLFALNLAIHRFAKSKKIATLLVSASTTVDKDQD